MARPVRTALLLTALAALTVPTGAATAACSSTLPVTDPHVAYVTCAGAHVGMLLTVPRQGGGTMTCGASFAFADQFNRRYVTFPGTCFLQYDCLEDLITDELPPPLDAIVETVPVCLERSDSELEPYWKTGGPAIKDQGGHRVGALVYAVNRNGVDFAIARLDAGVAFDPGLPLYGGPRRVGPHSTSVEEVHVYSPALPGVSGPNARSGLLHDNAKRPYVLTNGLLTAAPGTSVMRPDGTAIGFFVGAMSVVDGWVTQPLAPGVERAERRAKLDLRLMTDALG